MKKFARIAILAVGLVSLLFASCSDISDDALIATTSAKSSDTYKTLTLSVTSNSNLVDFSESSSKSARDILPEAQQVGNLWFYLCSKNNTAKASSFTNPVAVTVNEDENDTTHHTGSVVINLKKADYDFILYAVPKGENEQTAPSFDETPITQQAVLVGYANADIRTDDKVDFYLTAEGLTATGSVSLKLFTAGWKISEYPGYKANVRITYTKDTKIDQTTHSSGAVVDASPKEISNLPYEEPDDANYAITIRPGTYNFEVEFKKDSRSYTWSDRIVVLPGQATKKTVGIPLVIDKAPAKPKDFKVGYIDPANETTQYYTAEFVWDGTDINNEEKFVVQLMSLPSSVTGERLTTFNAAITANNAAQSDLDAAWNELKTHAGADSVVEYSNDFYGDEYVWVAGSLQKNNEMAQFRLLLGSRYVARICARNNAGDSDWVYATLNSAIVADNTKGIVAAKAFTSISINRYRVEYDLAGGTLVDDSDPDPQTVGTVYYYCQNFKTTAANGTETGGVKIMDASGKDQYTFDVTDADPALTVSSPKLMLGTNTWTNWLLNGQNYNEVYVSPANYGGYESLTLVANFATIGVVTIHDDDNFVIKDVVSTSTGPNPESPPTSGTATIAGDYPALNIIASQSTDVTLTWTLTYPTGVVYDKVTLVLTRTDGKNHYNLGNIVDATTNSSTGVTTGKFTLNVSEYQKGVYQAVISAWTSIKPQDPYTTNIILTIKD